jgi:hypothetical protein
MTMNGPILAHGKAAYVLEWAHSCPSETPPMTMNGPIFANEESCR